MHDTPLISLIAILIAEPWRVVAVVGVIVVGSLVAAIIVRGLGRSSGTAFEVAASLAQIGDFSFILGALGKSLGLCPTTPTR